MEGQSDMNIHHIEFSSMDNINPYDSYYKDLGLELKILDKSSHEFKLFEDVVCNTFVAKRSKFVINIIDVFQISHSSVNEKFELRKATGEKTQLLWHGTHDSWLYDVLHDGLKIQPHGIVNGDIFGKGIYFSDNLGKSTHYCYPDDESGIGFVLLNEVIIGESAHPFLFDPKLHKSKFVDGGLQANYYAPVGGTLIAAGNMHIRAEGIINGRKRTSYFNEYVIFDVDAVVQKFLFKVQLIRNPQFEENPWL